MVRLKRHALLKSTMERNEKRWPIVYNADVDELRLQPYAAQISYIEKQVASGSLPLVLLKTLATFSDYQPLAYAVAELAKRGTLPDGAASIAFNLPNTGLRLVLKELNGLATESFCRGLSRASIECGVQRIAALAMVDRFLKHNAPMVRDELVSKCFSMCVDHIKSNSIYNLNEAYLAVLPGEKMRELGFVAKESDCHDAWKEKTEVVAQQVVAALQNLPKSVSQANAEELLAKQVYSDPGHFLIELLQNAADAGATTWNVHVYEDRLEVEHDGLPFTACDVVGVLSIGQTTKTKEQIGFFGVGFKSVYEVCERPRIYSGGYAFEIANVSMPRAIAKRTEVVGERTILILPYRSDIALTARQLYEHLLAIPSEVLITLTSLRALNFSYEKLTRKVELTSEQSPVVVLKDNEVTRRMWLKSGDYAYDKKREYRRSKSTKVTVGIELGVDGLPIPIVGRPTIYSFLPTAEKAGVNFFLQARFDVPVDRERIILSSEWNRWVLARGGELLAQLAEEMVQSQEGMIARIAKVIPLVGELYAREYRQLLSALPEAMIFPSALGGKARASESIVTGDRRLSRGLGKLSIDGLNLLDIEDERVFELAKQSGASSCGAQEMVSAWAHALSCGLDVLEKDRLPEVLMALHEANADVTLLADKAFISDREGKVVAAKELTMAPAELEYVLQYSHRLLPDELKDLAPAILQQLGINTSDGMDFVLTLTDQRMAKQLVREYGSERILETLSTLPASHIEAAIESFLLLHKEVPVATGDVYVSLQEDILSFLEEIDVTPPLVPISIAKKYRDVLEKAGATQLTLSSLISCLESGAVQLPYERAIEFHELLNRRQDEMTRSMCKRLERLRVFPSTGGQLCTAEEMSVASDPEILELLPKTRWLDASVASLSYTVMLDTKVVEVWDVASALRLQIPMTLRTKILHFLSRNIDRMSRNHVRQLTESPSWPGPDGELHPLNHLRLRGDNKVINEFYDQTKCHPVLFQHSECYRAIIGFVERAGVNDALTSMSEEQVVRDLLSNYEQGSEMWNSVLQNPSLCNLVFSAEISKQDALGLLALPMFLCTDGARRPVATLAEADHSKGHYIERSLQPFLLEAGYPCLDVSTPMERFLYRAEMEKEGALAIVSTLADGHHEISKTQASVLRSSLVKTLGEIEANEALISILANLKLWPSGGDLLPAKELAKVSATSDWQPFLALCEIRMIDPEAREEAIQVEDVLPFVCPLQLLVARLAEFAKVDHPIATQPEPLNSQEYVLWLGQQILASEFRDEFWKLPLGIDHKHLLTSKELFYIPDELEAWMPLLPLGEAQADRSWALELNHVGLKDINIRRILSEVLTECAKSQSASNFPPLATREKREKFYAWLVDCKDQISRDVNALGVLGSCHVLHTSLGNLCRPKDLLFDKDLPDLGIDWLPSDDVPNSLQRWCKESYQTDSKRLRKLMEHLTDAIGVAAQAKDGPQLVLLVTHVARVIGSDDDEELQAQVKKFGLRKTMRVRTSDGTFKRPRSVLLSSGALAAELGETTAYIASEYLKPEVTKLLLACGASRSLSDQHISRLLDTDLSVEKRLALARYLFENSTEHRAVDLHSKSWVPTAGGAFVKPGLAYWPTEKFCEMLGEEYPGLVHPDVVSTTMPSFSFNTSLDLKYVSQNVRTNSDRGIAISPVVLDWLESQLKSKKVSKRAVVAQLQAVACVRDSSGILRPLNKLVQSNARKFLGDTYGDWPAAVEWPTLSKVFGISSSPTLEHIVEFLRDVVYLHKDGEYREGWHNALPNCLGFLVVRDSAKLSELPVSCVDASGDLKVLLFPSDRRDIALPAEPHRRFTLRFDPLVAPEDVSSYLMEYVDTPTAPVSRTSPKPKHKVEPVAVEESHKIESKEKRGFWSRVGDWFRGDDAQEPKDVFPRSSIDKDLEEKCRTEKFAAEREARRLLEELRRGSRHDHWFRPSPSLGPQMGANHSIEKNKQGDVPEFGFAHRPKCLPVPYLYASQNIFGALNRRSQVWRPLKYPVEWGRGSVRQGVVNISGALPKGRSVLPVPMFGEVTEVMTEGKLLRLMTGGRHVHMPAAGAVKFAVELRDPEIDDSILDWRDIAPREIRLQTCDDLDLPSEVHDLVATYMGEPAVNTIYAVRDFVRKRYVYDPTYLEDSAVSNWLRIRSHGKANAHISALHLGADSRHLGRGVCYELNTLVCEILRRLKIPSAVATGWTFDRGVIDEPDHLWAVALVAGKNGPKWVPVDAASTETGRPLRGGRRPPGRWTAPKDIGQAPTSPSWHNRMPSSAPVSRQHMPKREFARLVEYLGRTTGKPIDSVDKLIESCETYLADEDNVEELLELLRRRL